MKPSVLIIEDQPEMQRLYAGAFENAGFEVRSLNDGVGALGSILEQKPSIIILDILMPIKNGVDTLKELKNNSVAKDVPVLVFSAYDDSLLMDQALDLGASKYLIKSTVTPIDVVRIAKELLKTTQDTDEE